MSTKQFVASTNGNPENHSTPEMDSSATDIASVHREHLNVQREHYEWLNVARKGQVKNRRMLALLARMESMILDRDAKLASLMARVEAHEAQVQWYNQTDDTVEPTHQIHLDAIHIRYRTEHATVREIFSHFEEDEEQFNTQIEDIVQALLRAL
ncbi:MAG: hypothetical protein KDJ52_02790 [Anaerolineae bacterium]|nr:hypothetical protein [Anaerolineae bacterium]